MEEKEIYLSKNEKGIIAAYARPIEESLNYTYLSDIKILYGKALEDYKDYVKSGELTKAENIKKNVLKLYGDSIFVSPKITDKDPSNKNESYECLAGKFLYYSAFIPENIKVKLPITDKSQVHRSMLNYKVYKNFCTFFKGVEGIEFIDSADYFETLHNLILNKIFIPGHDFDIFSEIKEIVEYDFNKKAESAIEELKSGDREYDPITLKDFSPDDKDFKKYFKKGYTSEEEHNFYKKIKSEWENVLKDYEEAVKSKNKKSIKEDIKFKAIGKLSLEEAYEVKRIKKFYFAEKTPENFPNALLHKFCIFIVYDFNTKAEEIGLDQSLDPEKAGKNIALYSYKLATNNLKIDDNEKISNLSLNDLFKKFLEEAKIIFKRIDDKYIEILEEQENLQKVEERGGKYDEQEKRLLQNSISEEDFFFVQDSNGKKHIPISPCVEIDIKVYPENISASATNIPEWVSVTKRIDEISYSDNEMGVEFYSDNYFENFVINDKGDAKEIKLTLKSSTETNLEDLLFNSIIGPIKIHKQSRTEGIEELTEIIKNKNANFRIRFGYNDISEETINDSDINGINFSGRTQFENMKKPVVKSPWLYFMMNKFNVVTSENEMTFDIEGVTLGNYILDGFVLYKTGGDNTSFTFSYEQGTVINVLSEIAKSLYESSGKTLCILGGNKNDPEVIIGKENEKYKTEKIIFEDGRKNFAASDLDFDIFTSEYMASPSATVQPATSRSFSLITEEENKKKDLPTIKETLDYLVNWLPTRMFMLSKADGKNFAAHIRKTDNNVNYIRSSFTIKEIKPYYEILEANARLENESQENFSRRTFIRIFYKGPMANEELYGIRKYTYRGNQNSVIKNFSIENNVDFGKVKGTAGIIGAKLRSVYSADISILPENSGSLGNIVNSYVSGEDTQGSTVMIAKEGVVYYDSSIGENLEVSKETEKANIDNIASVFLYSMKDYGYKGEIEILGDPFFLSDRALQLGKYMIYLEINRNRNSAYEGGYKRSYYTGLYYITNIEHSMNSNGDFSTKLKIAKFFAE